MSLDQKFDNMNDTQRDSWLRWADSHDWAGDCAAEFTTGPKGELLMKTSMGVLGADGNWSCEDGFHATPQELRDWAGY